MLLFNKNAAVFFACMTSVCMSGNDLKIGENI